MEILNLFGVDLKLLLAQLVNFIVVVLVLWFFAIKPLMKITKERNAEIAKGLSDAQRSEMRLQEVEKEVAELLAKSRNQADGILDTAKTRSEELRGSHIEKTKQEVAVLIAKAKEQIQAEKENMVGEVKNDLADIVVAALHKILGEKIDKSVDKKYIEKVLSQADHE